MSIWFRFLLSDWQSLRNPELKHQPFVFAEADHNRQIIKSINPVAEKLGIYPGMTVADAQAITPGLVVLETKENRVENLLKRIGEWAMAYTPVVALDLPDGLLLDITGCAHLWGGEEKYLEEVVGILNKRGYVVRAAIADTIGCAWAMARFSHARAIVEKDGQSQAILPLHPAALRLPPNILETLHQLGMQSVGSFATISRSSLRRRFGDVLLRRLDQALGTDLEVVERVVPEVVYQEHLHCMEPIATRIGIEIAIDRLLEMLCYRLHKAGMGLRKAVLKGYRLDGEMVQVEIGTHLPSQNRMHLFKLFNLKIGDIQPELGIELFVLEAPKVEPILPDQEEQLWVDKSVLESSSLIALLDRVAGKVGEKAIHRYLPAEHHWPERSVKAAATISEKPSIDWPTDRPRPVRLLAKPKAITAMSAIPDYPPIFFIYQNERHDLIKADGPERIEQEWWLAEGGYRDYYRVEDKEGRRYWLFKSAQHENNAMDQWYLHGFFA